ncbi:MAG TPA: DinB family protein [Bryobacteraceae bacterium]|nr:DinB family protein [Bryobacteraceae bacterium]
MSPSAVESLVPELANYLVQIESVESDAGGLTGGLSGQQLEWRPPSGKWSMAQNIGHLNAAGWLIVPRIEASLRGAREKGLLGRGPFRHGALGNFVVGLTEPPPRTKFRAPKTMIPPSEPPEQTLAEFFRLQERVRELIREANGVDLARAKVGSPIVEWFKLTLGQTFALIAGHERRHLWQARQVRDDPQFPAR